MKAFIVTKSMIPRKSLSAPIGYWIGWALAPSLWSRDWQLYLKSAPVLSILLTNTIRGTKYSVACLQTVSVWGSTPAWASSTVTAPSSTLNERLTSTVKSTCPGVSMIFIRWPFQNAVVAAEVIVIPLSCSCSIQSICAAPSWVSPILWILPVWYRTLSVKVVLPASMWAMIPILRVCNNEYSRAIVFYSPITIDNEQMLYLLQPYGEYLHVS